MTANYSSNPIQSGFMSFPRAIVCIVVAALTLISLPAVRGEVPAPDYASSSRLSSGKWVKIKVRETGVHQITDQELRDMGFEHPERVGVYGFAAVELSDYAITSATPDDLPPVPSVYENGKLIFYGAGDVVSVLSAATDGEGIGLNVARNLYADYGTYFLTDTAPAAVAPEGEAPSPEETAVAAAYGVVHFEEELGNSTRISPFAFGKSFSEVPTQTYSFRMPGYTASERITMHMECAFQIPGSARLRITSPSGISKGVSLAGSDPAAYNYVFNSFVWTDGPAVADTGDYKVTFDGKSIETVNFGVMDYFNVIYPRSTVFDTAEGSQQRYLFPSLEKGENVAFSSQTEGLRVWDVTDISAPRVLPAVTASGSDGLITYFVASPEAYSLADGGAASFVVFDPASELLPVEVEGEVANTDLHSLASPEMVIISARSFMAEAERLAAAHRRIDGLNVEVVCQDDIYNEFSSGTPHVVALRRFVKMLYDRNPDKFRSVLLFGAAKCDNRDVTNGGSRSFRDTHIPILQQENRALSGHISRSYATDSYIGMTSTQEPGEIFNIYRTHMDVNVSRIPADNPGAATAVVDKTIRHMETPPDPVAFNSALVACDKGDALEHLKDIEKVSDRITASAPSTVVHKAYNPLFPLEQGKANELHRYMSASMSRGVVYWSYCGHSTPMAFGAEPIWNVSMVQSTPYDVLPLAVFATCRALYFDHQGNNIGEAALYQPDGGAIAVIGALREVYKDKNLMLHLELAREFFSAGPAATMGDVFRLARRKSVSTSSSPNDDLIINTLSYNMIGDPEVKVNRPQLRVALTSVDGKPYDSETPLTLGAIEPVQFEGCVTDAEGNPAVDFNGRLTFSLFDGERVAKVLNVGSSTGESKWLGEEYAMADEIIYEKIVDVEAGRFSFTASIPSPARPGSGNRITVAGASTDDRTVCALGNIGNVTVVPSESGYDQSKTSEPQISEMYIDSPSFADGDLVASNVTLHATVAPNYPGVVGNSSLLGQSVRLVLDGSRAFTEAPVLFVADSDGGGNLDIPLTDIEDGPHSLTLRVRNYAGQTVERTLHFTTVSVSEDAVLEVDEYPASECATVRLTAPYPDAVSGRVVVKNGSGNVVFTAHDVSFPYEWNLRGNDGKAVENGLYSVEVYFSSGLRHGFAGPTGFVVRRN